MCLLCEGIRLDLRTARSRSNCWRLMVDNGALGIEVAGPAILALVDPARWGVSGLLDAIRGATAVAFGEAASRRSVGSDGNLLGP